MPFYLIHNQINIDKLSLEAKKELFLLATAHAYNTSVQELDCSKSFVRKHSDKTFMEIFDQTNLSSRFTLFYRSLDPHKHMEFCVDTKIDGVDYFLYCNFDFEHLEKILKDKIIVK